MNMLSTILVSSPLAFLLGWVLAKSWLRISPSAKVGAGAQPNKTAAAEPKAEGRDYQQLLRAQQQRVTQEG